MPHLALVHLILEALQGEGQSLKSTLLLNKECISLLRQRVEDPVLGVSD
jgi:hypothetical protein